jgi:hypothetical protein
MDLSNKTCAVYDRGYNAELARVLARSFGTVYYFSEWKEYKPRDVDLRIGTGFGEIVRLKNFFERPVMDSDLFVFPFIYDGDLQDYLRDQGKFVWGTGRLDSLETDRVLFLETLKEIGLPVPPHKIIKGVSNLRDFLKDEEDIIVKTSTLRGSACGETFKANNYRQVEPKLDQIAYDLGPFQEDKIFVCCYKLDTPLEGGSDLFVVDGRIASRAMHGFEKKDELYVATHRKYEDLPELVREVNDAALPIMAKMRGPFSSEIRFLDNKPWWIDATMRIGSPPGELQQEWITNLAVVIYEAARGNLVEFEFSHEFACQVAVYSNWQGTNWQPIEIDPKRSDRLKMYAPCAKNGGLYGVPQDVLNAPWATDEHVGYVLGFGDTLDEMVQDVNETLDTLSGFGIEDKRRGLIDVVLEIKSAEEEGIKFTDKPIPETDEVVEATNGE